VIFGVLRAQAGKIAEQNRIRSPLAGSFVTGQRDAG
jgi:hypothetical protein